MLSSSILAWIYISAAPAVALIGHGIKMYNPTCAFACRAAIESAPLTCSTTGGGHGGDHDHSGGEVVTTPECRAQNDPFLTTLAWCMKTTCADFDVEVWRLEKYWIEKASEEEDVSVLPKWAYGQALEQVMEPPSRTYDEIEIMNTTVIVPHSSWDAERWTLEMFEAQETLHSRYGLVLLVTGFATPILFTILSYLPFMSGIFDKMKPYLVYPSTFGTYHVRSLPYQLGNLPTAGQGLYIAYLFILNVILTAVDYRATQPNTWFDSTWQVIMAYVSARTGVYSFALAPLVILFSSRNNFLLWCTNWSHSTYILLHRWVARIFGIQVILHSITELVLYDNMGHLSEEQVKPYWIWGIVATLAVCIMLVASVLYLRRWSYEVFLMVHIIMAVFVLVGSWYHVELRFQRKWGYQYWLYAACAVWFFDRLLRVLRIAKVGIKRARVTELGSSGIVRLDIDGVRWAAQPGFHAYAHFPTLSPFKPWENHPFSIISTAMLRSHNHSVVAVTTADQSPRSVSSGDDVEKSEGDIGTAATARELHHNISTTAGVTLYIRKSPSGRTRLLKDHEQMPTLLDGPYPNNPTREVLLCDRLVLVGGGIGITGLLPFANAHINVKLYWSVKQSAEPLVRDLDTVLDGLAEKEVRIGQRLDVGALLAQEARAGWKKIGVVGCGPGGLCDEVRAVVTRMGRKGEAVFELEVDAYSW